jgi:hypothetical protein
MCMIKPVPSTRVLDSGGAPLATIQGSLGMGLGIDQGTRIIIPVLAMPPADRFLTPAGQALVLRLLQMRRHECSSDKTR